MLGLPDLHQSSTCFMLHCTWHLLIGHAVAPFTLLHYQDGNPEPTNHECRSRSLRQTTFSSCSSLNTASAWLQLGIIPFAGVDIAAFEIFKEHLLHRYEGDPPPLAILGAGMMSSSIAQFASYPLALVRTRLQVRSLHLPSALRLQSRAAEPGIAMLP